MLIKRSIKFSVKKEKNGKSRVRMRVTYNGKCLDFQTGVVIDSAFWDEVHHCVTSSDSNHSVSQILNDQLSSIMVKMIEVFNDFEIRNVIPSPAELRNAYNGNVSDKEDAVKVKVENRPNLIVTTEYIPKEEAKVDFWKAYDEFVKVNGKLNDWTDGTRKKFSALRNHLYEFNPKLTFESLDENGLSDLIDFFGKKKGFKNSTTNKWMSYLRWCLRWCYQRGYNTNRTFEYYKPKLKDAQKHVIYLTAEELDKLEKYVIPKKYSSLEAVRDVFLFCCYTGLRHSDAFKLTWADVIDGKLEIVTKKTSDRIYIELNKVSMAILNKYKDYHFPGQKVLPVISNQKMNVHLHQLCKLAGIDAPVKLTHFEGNKRVDEVKPKYEVIGTHTGRRTFICMALSCGIPPSVVMKWTGHSDYQAMKPYIDITDDAKSMYMKKFDMKINA